MSQEKFRLSLEEMSSSQRTALLYLQTQINETRAKTVSKDEYTRLLKLVAQSRDENLEAYKAMCDMLDVLESYNIDEYKIQINKHLEKEHDNLNKHLEDVLSEFIRREEAYQEHHVKAQKNLAIYQEMRMHYFTTLYDVLKKSGIVIPDKFPVFVPVFVDRDGNVTLIEAQQQEAER